MLDYQARVIQEQTDLKDKIDKLTAFLDSEASSTVDKDQRVLLQVQLHAMSGYLGILDERIASFRGEKPPSHFRVVGIDFSLTSPAICIHRGSEWSPENCEFHFLTGNKKISGEFLLGRVHGHLFRGFKSDMERFVLNAIDIKQIVQPDENTLVSIEGYSFGSKGSRLFQIGEATGLVKAGLIYGEHGNLLNEAKNIRAFAPSAVKKFATGKGNADKQMMYDAFLAETNIDLVAVLGMKALGNPCHDIADAYFICKKLFDEKELSI